MYTVSKGSTIIVEKTRRGITQKTLESYNKSKNSFSSKDDPNNMSYQMPTFTHRNNNNYRNNPNNKKFPSGGNGNRNNHHHHMSNGNNYNHHYHHYNNGFAHNNNVNGNSSSSSTSSSSSSSSSFPNFTHEEQKIISYVSDNWNDVIREFELGQKTGSRKVAYYHETEPSPLLRNFEPFDLENWWGKKTYQRLTSSAENSSSSSSTSSNHPQSS